MRIRQASEVGPDDDSHDEMYYLGGVERQVDRKSRFLSFLHR